MKIFPAGIQKTAMPIKMRRIEDVEVGLGPNPSSIAFSTIVEPINGDKVDNKDKIGRLHIVLAPKKALGLTKDKNLYEPGRDGYIPENRSMHVLVDNFDPNSQEMEIFGDVQRLCNNVVEQNRKGFLSTFMYFEHEINFVSCEAYPRTSDKRIVPIQKFNNELLEMSKLIEKALVTKGYSLDKSLQKMTSKWDPYYLPR